MDKLNIHATVTVLQTIYYNTVSKILSAVCGVPFYDYASTLVHWFAYPLPLNIKVKNKYYRRICILIGEYVYYMMIYVY